MFASIPLLIIVVIAYNFVAFSSGIAMGDSLANVALMSGSQWTFTIADLTLSVGLFLLYLEIFNATRSGTSSIINHILSLLLFIGCLLEFLIIPEAASSTFFLIMFMTLVDVIAGFTVTISTARRDIGYNG